MPARTITSIPAYKKASRLWAAFAHHGIIISMMFPRNLITRGDHFEIKANAQNIDHFLDDLTGDSAM